MKGLQIVRTGVLALIADGGRNGYADIGITRSGMADRYSGTWANKLLSNHPDTALLEISIGGMELISHIHTCIALTGAQANLMINSRSKKTWRSHKISPGDTIKIGMASRGQRLYLAVKGGFDTVMELGSRSSTPREGLGAKLQSGDLLPCDEYDCRTSTFVPYDYIPSFPSEITLRALPSYQWESFLPEAKDRFFAQTYEVTRSSDRMGCRLAGEPISSAMEIISESISYGAVQIPADGQPIVLLNERQTIGGYPKIATLLPMDSYMLSQARPGTKVRFRQIQLFEAMESTKKLYKFLSI